MLLQAFEEIRAPKILLECAPKEDVQTEGWLPKRTHLLSLGSVGLQVWSLQLQVRL
jgi:hypothetical protein